MTLAIILIRLCHISSLGMALHGHNKPRTLENGEADDVFGRSVSIYGEFAVGTQFSSCKIFTRSNSTWATQANFFSSDGASSVSINGIILFSGLFLTGTIQGARIFSIKIKLRKILFSKLTFVNHH